MVASKEEVVVFFVSYVFLFGVELKKDFDNSMVKIKELAQKKIV